jgi:hypothetical protein
MLAKTVLVTFALLGGLTTTVRADYSVPPAYDVLGASPLILEGAVSRLDKENYQFRIKRVLAGRYTQKTITIKRFRNWTCAQRWAPYAVGQKMVVALRKLKPNSARWVVRSAGGEGEMPLLKKAVLVRGLMLAGWPKSGTHQLGKHQHYGQLVPLAEFSRLVSTLRQCFRFRMSGRWFRVDGAKRTCSARDLAAAQRKDAAFARLSQTIKKRFKTK